MIKLIITIMINIIRINTTINIIIKQYKNKIKMKYLFY